MISAHEANALATARISRDLARMLARVDAVPVQRSNAGDAEHPSSIALALGGSPEALDRESQS